MVTMIEAIGIVGPFAIGVALSPLPIIAVVLVLLGARDRRTSLSFLGGRLLGVSLVVVLVATAAEAAESSERTSPVVAAVRVVVGLGLLLLAVRKHRGRPGPDDDPELPGWIASIERASPVRALRLALVLSVANVKELFLNVAAGLAIGSLALPLGRTLLVSLVYTVVACLSVIAPVVAVLVAPDRTRRPLLALRAGLVRHSATIMGAVLLVLGVLLVSNGISDLV